MKVNHKRVDRFNRVLLVVILCTVAFNIVFLMRYNFEADSAFFVTLAQEQIRTKSLFPEGIYYSTGLFVLTPNLLIIPFLFLTDNLVLARQLAILLLWFFIYFLIYKIFVTKNERDLTSFIIASSLFSILYINASVVSMHFYQGAYITHVVFLLLFILLMKKILTDGKYDKSTYICTILIFLLANLGELRNLLIWGVPALLAYLLYIFIKAGWNYELIKDLKKEQCFIQVLCCSMMLCFIVSVFLARKYGTFGTTEGLSILMAKDYGKSIYAIIVGLFDLFGNSYMASLFSLGGFCKLANFIVTIFINFFIPIFAIKKYKFLKSEFSRFLVLLLLISSSLYLFIVFITGVCISTDRYLIPIYNNHILLTSVIVSQILHNYFKKRTPIAVACILFYVMITNFAFLGAQKNSFTEQSYGYFAEGVEGVTEFLENHELFYGYATFNNAEEYTILSNNRVKIRSVSFIDENIYSYNWLTASRFYDPDFYIGKSFLMLTNEQMEKYFPNGLSKLNFGNPIEILKYKKFTIFVYDYNISSKINREAKVFHINRGGESWMVLMYD